VFAPPLHVTGVQLSQQAQTGCTVVLTGRISTNGANGTISYQWVFQPQTQPPESLSAVAGQHAVDVTVAAAIEGQGHGSASQTVTLEVLHPNLRTASTTIVLRC
jgi:hypothetical protein